MITYTKPVPVSLPITESELLALGIPAAAIASGEFRGELKTFGPWQIAISYRALCMSTVYTPKEHARFTAESETETVYGLRTLSDVHESGYALEGRVSVNGRKVRGFTSSQLFKLPDGRLINVDTIHACL